jgi:hypothetical protein
MHPNDLTRIALAGLVAAALAALRPGILHAAEQHIVCPPQVDAKQVTVTAPAGWIGLFRPSSRALLSGAAVWIGPVNEGPGELIGETVTGKDGAIINRFASLDSAPLVDGVPIIHDKWMVCYYDGRGGIVQAKKLPKETKQCDVTYKRVPDPLEPGPKKKLVTVLADITCQ